MNTNTPRMTLANITRGKQDKPFRVVIYGVEGVGKTTFASEAPSAIVLPAEQGAHHLDVARFPVPQRWEDVHEAVRVLTEEEHDFKTFVLDALDPAEALCWDYVARQAGKADIEAIGYGKGYTAAVAEWRQFLASLDRLSERRGMHIILIGHSHIKTFKNPVGEDFDRYMLQLHEKSAAVIRQWPDAMLFAQYEVIAKHDRDSKRTRGIGTGERVLQTEHGGGWDAKNRYNLPPVLPLSWHEFVKAAEEGLSGRADELIAECRGLISELTGDRRTKAEDALGKIGRDTDRLERCVEWLRKQIAEQQAEQVAGGIANTLEKGQTE